MRTTLDIDDDVLQAAKELAVREKKTAGKILSMYFRRAFHANGRPQAGAERRSLCNGVPVLPSRGEVITTKHVERLMEDEGI